MEIQDAKKPTDQINEPVTYIAGYFFYLILSAAGLCFYLSYFKMIYHKEDFRVWEELYGRNFFFFFFSIVGNFAVRNENASFFEIHEGSRWSFAARILFLCIAYGFTTLSIAVGKNLISTCVVLTLQISFIRLITSGKQGGVS